MSNFTRKNRVVLGVLAGAGCGFVAAGLAPEFAGDAWPVLFVALPLLIWVVAKLSKD